MTYSFEQIQNTIALFGMRSLTNKENQIAESIFGSEINLNLVRINEFDIGTALMDHVSAFVTFHTINVYGGFDDNDPKDMHTFVHDLVHVWQYEKFGASYIVDALHAQDTTAKYNYGGYEGLMAAFKKGWTLTDFNFEQQAEIVSDYYAIRQGLDVQDRQGNSLMKREAELPLFAHFVQEVSDLSLDELDGGTVVATDKGDLLFGNEIHNRFEMGLGDDTVYSWGGNDQVFGEEGNDKIYAGAGNDWVFGGVGDDTISTGTGNDFVIAGSGNDVVYANSGKNTVYGGSGNDKIHSSGKGTYKGGDGDDIIFL